ncbi:phosphohydrolase [Lachnoclostridium sp. An169]|uniref:HD domain-containing protein n=1 Tax=Lachnoclostridium sp. An169 TaxID=1965569 RepID=UPI000B376CCC|nr:HD domain-containing protein [Lachnoclostridium sp. An169]OUP86074.1 phosphohydrolase [Lachnoclostridium sp. An169]
MIDDAIEFATKAHDGQFRKGTRRPYIVHPIEVADIVSTMTRDEEVICAAVLHDTIEDCSGITKDILKLQFGDRVADMVSQESEDKSQTWEERKGNTITRLKDASVEVQMIGLADKLSNMRDIDRDYPTEGEALWMRFRMQSKSAMAWYYKGIRDVLRENFEGVPAYEEYCRLIDKNFGPGPAGEDWRKGDS